MPEYSQPARIIDVEQIDDDRLIHEQKRIEKVKLKSKREATREVDDEEGALRRTLVVRADTVIPTRTRWLWAPGADALGRIPMGELTLIVGRGGTGKSTLLCTMGAWITTGDMQGEFWGTPRDVIYIANEDSLTSTVVPRLIAAKADLSRVHFLTMSFAGQEDRVMLPTDCAAIEELVAQTGVVAVMADPLSSSLRVDNGNDPKKVRPVVEAVRRMCERAGIAALGLAHTRKAESKNLMDAILGSSELGNVCRSAMGVMNDPDEDGQIVLSQEKSNLGRMDVPSYLYQIGNHTFWAGEESISTGKLEFLGKTDLRVSDMMSDSMQAAGGASSVKECARWLYEYLAAHGEVSRAEVLGAGSKEKFQEHTVQRAAKKLKVKFDRRGFPSVSVWSLPSSNGSQDKLS